MNPDPSRQQPAAAGKHSAQAAAASELLAALNRAARSFSTYDSQNEVVRRLIGVYQQRAQETLAVTGELVLEVHPFDLMLADESVYHEVDREKSLAFRLFRDGVRRLTIAAATPWEELLDLLEVLSIRFVGVRQQEDDLLTLLRRAEFKTIEILAVEGYAPDEEDPEDTSAMQHLTEKVLPPEGWDQPHPQLSGQSTPGYQAVTADQLTATCAEVAEEQLASLAVEAGLLLLDNAASTKAPTDTANLLSYFSEVGEYLALEQQPGQYARLIKALQQADPALPEARALLATMTAPERLTSFLQELKPGFSGEAIAALFELAPGDHVALLLDRLSDTADLQQRSELKLVLAQLLRRKPDALLPHLSDAPEGIATDLFAVISTTLPDKIPDTAYLFCGHSSAKVRLGAIDALTSISRTPRLDSSLRKLLADPEEAVRCRAATVYAQKAKEGAFAVLRSTLEASANQKLSGPEAAALGQALAQAAPKRALELFAEVIKQHTSFKGRMLRLVQGVQQRALCLAAAAGLELMGDQESLALLTQLAASSDEAIQRRCNAALAGKKGARHGA